ncbi:hypothetical protein DFQ30_005923, partial [Apophysomyces sp. BC1015]
NKRYQGLIDTGAEISVINRKICLANKWHFSSVSGKIHYAGKGHSVNRIGITELLEIKYNNRTITHQFEVMDLSDTTDIILGYDILPKLGITLQGVAYKWDDQIEQ